MRLLLDTHVFLWYVTADPKLPAAFRAAIQDPANDVYLSVASVWEAVIKQGLGKLPLPGPAADYLSQQREVHGIASLPVDEGAMRPLASLPPLHRDPFDRLLVAQALQHGLTVVTIDPAVAAYPAPQFPNTGRGEAPINEGS
jgi:PIN domain nuclease of toxin-antitoxin system